LQVVEVIFKSDFWSWGGVAGLVPWLGGPQVLLLGFT